MPFPFDCWLIWIHVNDDKAHHAPSKNKRRLKSLWSNL
ncbi:hypothetical protein MANES_05G130401v8 [Manihot esculenta]|uniref:Uncharacterized protein n=1 Tax=Manihot esculenta TaxID=3983 RepID=A0ACB7HPJ6_MANES|nr:hypothetical protein MANES_05G130401v8 [Manihot esculenta]